MKWELNMKNHNKSKSLVTAFLFEHNVDGTLTCGIILCTGNDFNIVLSPNNIDKI